MTEVGSRSAAPTRDEVERLSKELKYEQLLRQEQKALYISETELLDRENRRLRAALLSRSATPDQDDVLLDGVSCGYSLTENGVLLHVEGKGRWLDLIDGTRVRVVAVPNQEQP